MLDGIWHFVPSMTALTAGMALFANELPPPSLEDLSRRIKRPVFFIYAGHGQGGENLNAKFYAAAERAEDALEDLGRRAHRRHRGQAGRV